MLLSDAYLEMQKEMHRRYGDRYGASGKLWAAKVATIKARNGYTSVLDYGCGQGLLRQVLGRFVKEYDPAIKGKDHDPEPADLVVCTDVLEHIEPDFLPAVLIHIHSKVKKQLLFSASLVPAGKLLADGRNAHLILESAEWWREQISKYFYIFKVYTIRDHEFAGLATPKILS